MFSHGNKQPKENFDGLFILHSLNLKKTKKKTSDGEKLLKYHSGYTKAACTEVGFLKIASAELVTFGIF